MKSLLSAVVLLSSLSLAAPSPTPSQKKPSKSEAKVQVSTPASSKDSKKKPVSSAKKVKPYKAKKRTLTPEQKKELEGWLADKVAKKEMSQKQADDAIKYGEWGVYDVMLSEKVKKK